MARLAPAAAIMLAVVGGSPAQAATGTITSSPGSLALTLGTASVSPIAVGQSILVGLAVTNTSADPIGPFTYTFHGSANTKLSPNFADPHTCNRAAGNTVSCVFMGALQPGMLDNSLGVNVTPLSAGPFDVMATVDSALGSSVTPNSVDLPMTAIVGTADLQVAQRVSNAQPAAGAPLTYTIDIKNAGPNAALGAVASEYVGVDGAPLSAVASNGANCAIAGQLVSCNLGDLASGSSVSISVSAVAPLTFGGTVVSTASATSSTYDPNAANNTASASVRMR